LSSKTTKSKVKRPLEERLASSISKIPLSIFVARKTPLTVFEALVFYLKEVKGLRYREIADLLDKDERNIWTVYNRAKKKREKLEKSTQ